MNKFNITSPSFGHPSKRGVNFRCKNTRFKSEVLKIFMILFVNSWPLIINSNVYSQSAELIFIQQKEIELQKLFDSLSITKIDSIKLNINETIKENLSDIFRNQESYEYPFSKIKYLGKTLSDDGFLRVYNWNIPMSDFTNKCFGFVQFKDKKLFRTEFLDDKFTEIENPERANLSPENWYGALYYQAIASDYKRTRYYVLLGWRGKNEFISQKVVDALEIDKNGEMKFNSPVFRAGNDKKKRLIFEFSSRVSMSLRYDEIYKMIVYDHLSPAKPMYTGQKQYYGPDFSYDGLEYEKGKWTELIDIDIKSPKKPTSKKTNN